MYCSNCGKQISPNSNFCQYCGLSNNQNQVQINTYQKKNGLNVNHILIGAIVLIICFCIIGGFFYINKNNAGKTIMIYMVGTDLETTAGLASRDLKDLDYQKTHANNINVLIMAGGTKTWKNDYIDSTETSIYELTQSGFVKVNQRQKDNMGDAKNLTYFLNYSYENYKTQKYDLVFWNHGGAVDGSEYDELSGNMITGNDNLKLPEMKTALEESYFNKNNKLEVVSFRTCLNATLEVANIYKDYADYLIASEEVTVGSTIDSALRYINNIQSTDNGINIGKKQIETYKETVTNFCNHDSGQNIAENYCLDITYSLIDLSKIDELNNSLNNLSQDLNSSLKNNYNEISRIRSNLNQYAASEPSYDMIDLYDFADNYSSFSTNSEKVKENINSAVIYNFSNNNYSHGLSIYHPYNSNIFMNTYDKITPSNNYLNYLNNFINLKNNNKSNYVSSFNNKEAIVKETKKETADFEIELTTEEKEKFAKAQYSVFVDTKDGYHKLLYVGKSVKLEGNKLKANVQGKLLRFSDIEYDDDNCWITLVEKEVTDDYVDVVTFPILNRGLNYVNANVTIRIDDKHPNGYITSTIINGNNKNNKSDFSLFSNIGSSIKDYTYIDRKSVV